MRFWKISLITAVATIGLFATTTAQAQEYYRPTTIARPIYRQARRYRTFWYRGQWVRRPIYVQPVYQTPVYQYQTPVYNYQQPDYAYQQPTYENGCNAFAEHVRAELMQIEEAVRERVASGELDGSALTTMEAARDDMLQDVVDLSAKGYITDADRAHIENDMRLLRQKFGW